MKKMRRSRIYISLILMILPALAGSQETQTLTISSWGGAYEEAQLEAYILPFEQETGIKVSLVEYNGGIAPLRLVYSSGKSSMDVVDMTESDALAACEENLLAKTQVSLLLPAPDGTPVSRDFRSDAISDCGVAHLLYATVLAYDDRAFSDEKPSQVADFFDIEKFPGKRALQRHPKSILEWALLSYGVPVEQVYDLLSSERGLRLVTRRLDEIRDHIVWWESGNESVELLRSGAVVMASGFNGRFFDARINHNLPISIMPKGQLLEFGVWGVSRHSPQRELAEKFVSFATSTESMAAFSNLLPYGPTRQSAFKRIGLHSKSNVSMRLYMPTSSSGLHGSIRADSIWYSQTERVRERWFNEWLQSSR